MKGRKILLAFIISAVTLTSGCANGTPKTEEAKSEQKTTEENAVVPIKPLTEKAIDDNPYMAKSDANIHHDCYNSDTTDEVLPVDIYPEINVSYETVNKNASPAVFFDTYGHAVVPLQGGLAIRDINADEAQTEGYFSPAKHDGGGYVIQSSYSFVALEWVCKSEADEDVEAYMSQHRHDTDIQELKTYFTSVIDWISGVFSDVESEMRGIEWGRLFETYHNQPYDPVKVSDKLHELYADGAVKKRAGIFEYILGGCKEPRLLEIRIFEESTKKAVYTQQTDEAKKCGKSNCPLCALEIGNNSKRIWKFNEMDADHVTAWSKGGATDISNCQMLCKTHNRAKGNK